MTIVVSISLVVVSLTSSCRSPILFISADHLI